MPEFIDIITPLHTSTKRTYLDRMMNDKVMCAMKAKEYEFDYWDGEKCYGYGGYQFIPGRWKPVAEKLVERYQLTNQSKILDIGCGKGFLLHEIKLLLPNIEVVGFDISQHALSNAKDEVKSSIKTQRAQDKYPFVDHHFDLIVSLNTLHNLR